MCYYIVSYIIPRNQKCVFSEALSYLCDQIGARVAFPESQMQ